MTRRNIKTWISTTLAATGLAAISIFAFVRATPVPDDGGCKDACPPIGVEICCPGVSKSQLEALGYTLTVETQTNGCFVVTSCIPPCSTTWYAELEAKKFEGVGYTDELGRIDWRLDPDRTSDPATLKSYNKDEQFTAYGTITFYAEAEVEKFPGLIFKSAEQVHLVNEKVLSFNPFKEELFTMQGEPIKFYNEESGESFVLHELTSLLTERKGE